MESLSYRDTTTGKTPLDREALRDVIDLALWAGQLLLQHGAESEQIEQTIHRLGTALGCDWMDILVSPNVIAVTTISGEEFRTKIRRVIGLRVNLTIISAINRLTRRVQHGELDRFGVRQELVRISSIPSHYNRWLVVAWVGLACAAFARLFGADWSAFAATFLAASAGMVVRQELTRLHYNAFLVVIVTAFVAGLLASAAVRLDSTATPRAVLAASVLLLVPGVPLINSAEDLIKGHMVTGIVRGITGLLYSLAIALGLSLAIQLMGVPISAFQVARGTSPPPLEDALWSALAATGFALLFNVPVRTVAGCAFLGAVGHGFRTMLVSGGMGLEAATLVGATLIGFIGAGFARYWDTPSPVYTISGAIPMVPGVLAFQAMLGLLRVAAAEPGVASAVAFSDVGIFVIKTALILGGIAIGIAAPSLLFVRQKPVV
ncbi:MAG: threonine/serine exporter family protein [Chloroflexi bacterium]|nr:threonine/serine exporter family protein [Chloroflexota bacterium]